MRRCMRSKSLLHVHEQAGMASAISGMMTAITRVELGIDGDSHRESGHQHHHGPHQHPAEGHSHHHLNGVDVVGGAGDEEAEEKRSMSAKENPWI